MHLTTLSHLLLLAVAGAFIGYKRSEPPRRHDNGPPPEPYLEAVDRFLGALRLLRELAGNVASALILRAASFVRAPLSASLSVVLAWAAFLLAPGSAAADTGTASSGSSLTTVLAGLGLFGGGSILLLLVQKLVPKFLSWLADDEVPAGVKVLEHDVDTSAEGMAHPEATAIIDHQLQNLAGNVSSALHKAGADLSTISALTPAALLGVAKDAAADFLAGVDEDKLGQALEQLGAAEAPDVEAWAESQALKLLHISKPAPVAAPTAKVVLTTADGTHIVAPAANPSPGAQAGSAASRLALVLGLLGTLTMACASGCSAAQKATEKQDAEAIASQLIDCATAQASTDWPMALAEATTLVSSGSVTTTALEGLGASVGKPYAKSVAVCAVEDLVKDAAAALATPPDGGTSVAVADCQRVWALEKSTRAFLAAHAHKPAPKKAG